MSQQPHTRRVEDGEGITTEYSLPDHIQFIDDMRDADEYEISLYHGRGWYKGPCVHVDEDEVFEDLQDAIRATSVKVSWDSCGKTGCIVHPAQSDSTLKGI